MAVEKGRATKAVPKPKVKAQAQRKPTPVAAPLTTGDKAVDAILARIQQMAGPAASIDSDPGLPADYNAKGGDAERKKLLSQPDGGFKLNGPKGSDFHKLLDIIMRPGQALKTGIRYDQDQDSGAFDVNVGAFAKGLKAGFTGKDVTTGRQLFNNATGGKNGKGGYNGPGAGTAGFFLDVGIDPINLTPGAPIGRVLNRLDDTVLGAAKITTPAAKKRAANAAAGLAQAAPAAAANTAASATGRIGDRSVSIATAGKPAPLGTAREIAEEEARVARSLGRIQPKTAGDDLFGAGEMKATLPTVKPIPKPPVTKPQPVAIPVATPATMPAPKALGIDDLDDAIKAKTLEVAKTKIGPIFDTDDLSSKMSASVNGAYGNRLTWEQVSSNPDLLRRVTTTPQFKQLFGKVLNDERVAAASQINATRMAEYHASVKAIEEAAQKAAPDVTAQLDEITSPEVLPTAAAKGPKELSEIHKIAGDNAASLHIRNHGPEALTSLGQAKLRQTVANEYFKAKPNAIKWKNTKNVQSAINRIYIRAEQALVDMGTVPVGKRLSEVMDQIDPKVFSDPAALARAIDAGDVVSAAKGIASDLPKGVQASFVKSLLEGLKVSGNAADVAQAKYMGKPELKFRVAEAVAEDIGVKLPTIQFERILKSSKDYESAFAVFGRMGELIDKSFRTAYQKTPWEQSATRMGQGAVNTMIEQDINYLRTLVKGTDKAGFQAAFESAQRGGTEPMAAKILEYQTHITEMMKRAGVSENEFVKKLKSIPEFKDVNKTLGFDMWTELPADKRHAAQLMALYANAAHNATLNATLAGHLGPLFGAVTAVHGKAAVALAKSKGYVRVADEPSLDGMLFPAEFAPRIKELLQMAGPQGVRKTNEFFKFYDKGLSLYKVGLTKYLPSHHITNHIGGMYMAWLDGMNNPAWLKRSWNVMRQQEAAATGVLDEASSFTLKTGSGHAIKQGDIMRIFNESGLRPSFAGIADLASESAELKIKNGVATAVDRASQAREVQIRLSHFMFALSKEKGSLDEAIRNATMRVQKHHGDYGDLTDFERRVMRRAIPFYTWQRKVVPTLIRQAASNPAKIMVYPKLQQSINSHFGIDPEPGNPFPGGALTPSFMTEGIQSKYGTNAAGNEIWGAPRTPFDDAIGKAVNHPVGNILEMLTPAIKAPYELKSGTAIGNSDIRTLTEKKDKRDYVEQNTPLLSLLVRLTRRSPLHGFESTQDGEDEQGTNIPALINLLTGANLKENNQRMQTIAERERASQANG